jgi:HK97 family phage portal protein
VTILRALVDRPREHRALQPFGNWQPSRTYGGVAVSQETALTLSAVWACQTLISDSVATMPQDTFRKSGDDRVETTPPTWLTTPNEFCGLIDFDTQRILSLLGKGEAYSMLVRENSSASGRILERWVLDPKKCDVRNHVVYYENQPFRPWEVQRIIGYRLPGHEMGMNPIQYAARMLGIGLAAEEFDAEFFNNGANASGVLQVPELPVDASKSVVDRIREQLMEAMSGLRNMRKPLVLTGGTTWNQTSVNPEDAQLIETRKFQVSDVARFFRVPPHMIGDVDRSTSWGTGIEVQGRAFVQFTLGPWISRLEEADSALLPRPQFVKRNVNALVRGDMAARREWYRAGLEQEWLLRSEVRALEELPPIDGIDDRPDPTAFDPDDPGTTEGGPDGPQ